MVGLLVSIDKKSKIKANARCNLLNPLYSVTYGLTSVMCV